MVAFPKNQILDSNLKTSELETSTDDKIYPDIKMTGRHYLAQ